MKIFIISKRFLIPFFIAWILSLLYLQWELWRLWGDEFKNKEIPSKVIYEWLLMHISLVLIFSFINAFLLGIVYYSHYQTRKERYIAPQFFSKWNLLLVILISFLAFLYSSFVEPKNQSRSQKLLAEIVWTKPGERFSEDSLQFEVKSADFRMNPRAINIKELFHARDSLRQMKNNDRQIDFPFIINSNSGLRAIELLINKKFAWLLIVMLFYFVGVFLGASFYKIHVIVPLLIGYFVFLTGWFYLQNVFEWFYKQQKLGAFLAANGATICVLIFIVAWFLALKKYGLFIKKEFPEIEESMVSPRMPNRITGHTRVRRNES